MLKTKLSPDELKSLSAYFKKSLSEFGVDKFVYRNRKMNVHPTLTIIMAKMVNEWFHEKGV